MPHDPSSLRLFAASFALTVSVALAACGESDAAPAPAAEPTAVAAAPEPPAAVAEAEGGPAQGKYGCIETVPRFRNGGYEFEFEPRGAVHLHGGGRYTDPFGNDGTWGHDATAGETRFTGGALDEAVATPMEDEPERIRVVIPTESGERRWTCSPA